MYNVKKNAWIFSSSIQIHIVLCYSDTYSDYIFSELFEYEPILNEF